MPYVDGKWVDYYPANPLAGGTPINAVQPSAPASAVQPGGQANLTQRPGFNPQQQATSSAVQNQALQLAIQTRAQQLAQIAAAATPPLAFGQANVPNQIGIIPFAHMTQTMPPAIPDYGPSGMAAGHGAPSHTDSRGVVREWRGFLMPNMWIGNSNGVAPFTPSRMPSEFNAPIIPGKSADGLPARGWNAAPLVQTQRINRNNPPLSWT